MKIDLLNSTMNNTFQGSSVSTLIGKSKSNTISRMESGEFDSAENPQPEPSWLHKTLCGSSCYRIDSKMKPLTSTAVASRKSSTVTARIEFSASKETQQKEAQTTATSTLDYIQCTYKLIDLGTAVGVHDEEIKDQNQSMRTLTEMAFAG